MRGRLDSRTLYPFAVGFYIEGFTAVFAVDGVRVVAAQTAGRAFVVHAVWTENGLDESQKQANPKNHDADGEQPPGAAFEGDVAEAGGCQCRYREVERVDIIGDQRVDADLHDVDQGGDKKDKDREIENAVQNFLVALEKFRGLAQLAEDVVGA